MRDWLVPATVLCAALVIWVTVLIAWGTRRLNRFSIPLVTWTGCAVVLCLEWLLLRIVGTGR